MIDSDEVQNGTLKEIDLSKYPDITDYSATINKSIKITDTKSKDLTGATLQVVSDNVTLTGIKGASVTTQSSLKISGSSLSSLSIAAVSSSGSLSSVEVNGRGENGSTSTGLSAHINPPTVETDNTTIANEVKVEIENAQITAEKFIAGEINLAGMNTQLTIKDTATSISAIKTDKICQVILEAGASSTIPTTKEKISVTGNGELTQIDIMAISSKKLIAFTPMSGVKSVVKKGNIIDFSDVVMLGTYLTEGNGIKVFRALSEEEFTDTFSKLEKNFVVKIGDDKTVVFKNGRSENLNLWSNLEAKTYPAYIISEYQPQDAGCEYQFEITVLDVEGDGDELPKFELTSIEVQSDSAKTEYKVGDTLDLRGLVVWGTYTASNSLSYKGLVTDYTLSLENGTVLSESGDKTITVKAKENTTLSDTFSIKVKPIWTVTFVKDLSGDEQKVVQGDKAKKPDNPVKSGYTFDGWYEKIGEAFADTSYDFNTAVTRNITLYAKLTANIYKVTLNNDGDTSIVLDVTFDTIVPNITKPSKTGYTFGGYWTQADGQGTQYIDSDGKGKKWNIAENTTLYAYYMERDKHLIYYYNTKGAANLTNPQQFREADAITLPTISADGYQFNGWYDSSTDFSDAHHITGWIAGAKTDNVSLWAKWTASQVVYKVKYLFQNVAGNGYDQSGDVVTKTGLTDTTTDVSAENNITGFDLLPIVQQNIAGNGSTVVEVKYNRKTITYTFKANGGNWSGSTADKTAGGLYGAAIANKPDDPTKTGYTFSGWDKQIPDNFDETKDFTAQWTANHYTVTLNNGDGVEDTTIDVTFDANVPAIALPDRTHYTFGGYYLDNTNDDSKQYINADGIFCKAWDRAANTTLYAKWTANTYKIKFDANEGTGTMNVLPMTYGVSAKLTKNTFTRVDYVFKGWSMDPAAVSAEYTDEQNVKDLTSDNNAEVTLYAVWSNTYVMPNGNMRINGVEYVKTSLKDVIPFGSEAVIDGSDDWTDLIQDPSDNNRKGVFRAGRKVKLSPYSIGRFEVTHELYIDVMQPTSSSYTYSHDKNDMTCSRNNVNFYRAIALCNKLSLLMGKDPCYTVAGIEDWLHPGTLPTETDATWDAVQCDFSKNGYRLPTEAEWEFAARGGDTSEPDWKYIFAGATTDTPILLSPTAGNNDSYHTDGGIRGLISDVNLDRVARYNNTTYLGVGSLEPNRLGLYDMSGNLYEMCWDWYNDDVTVGDADKTVDGVVINPTGPSSGTDRCKRGGGFNSRAYCCIVLFRTYIGPYSKDYRTGFRIAQTLTE